VLVTELSREAWLSLEERSILNIEGVEKKAERSPVLLGEDD